MFFKRISLSTPSYKYAIYLIIIQITLFLVAIELNFSATYFGFVIILNTVIEPVLRIKLGKAFVSFKIQGRRFNSIKEVV